MPTVTPINNWPIPEDTDLVKDGAKAIRDLGNAIDTSSADFAGGLVHIETQTFSAVASQSFNDVFSATYNTYKIICRLESSAAGEIAIRYRLRVAGADATGADYVSQLLQGDDSSAFALRQTSLTSLQIGATTNSTDFPPLTSFELNNPFLTVKTNHISSFVTAAPIVGFFGGLHSLTNSYTGITFFGSSGNLTGTISIYGYAKA
jgi:hypothetical protein